MARLTLIEISPRIRVASYGPEEVRVEIGDCNGPANHELSLSIDEAFTLGRQLLARAHFLAENWRPKETL